MSDRDHARALLAMAQKDLRALTGMTDAAVFADEIFGFHAQQAVEKALKAWLAVHGIAYPRTHDLSLLLGLLEDAGEKVGADNRLLPLNAFAVAYRYEALPVEPGTLDRQALITEVSDLLARVSAMVDG